MQVLMCLLLFLLAQPSRGFNHWVVTEEGKIEYQVASPFNLRQSFDLMALIQQEQRISAIKELREELIEYKNEFESYPDHESFDENYRALDPGCQNVQMLSSYDLYVSTVLPLEHKGIKYADHLDLSTTDSPGEPHCTATPLDYSIYALEHLEAVQSRRSLVAPPEKSVLGSVDDMRIDVFASRVYHALEKNSTSWVLLDLATLYWRARGNPLNAIECIRRALHYSPEYAMDIALLNLANVLHRSQHTHQAVVPLSVAISLSPTISVLYYTLGNVYAVLNQLNESVRSFKRCSELKPDCETSRAMYQAALCDLKIEEVSRERSDRLDETQKKLDQFYENIDLMRQNQYVSSQEEEIGAFRSVKRKPKKKSTADEDDEPATNATPLSDPNLSFRLSTTEENLAKPESRVNTKATSKDSAHSELRLEQALDAAVRNSSVGGATTPTSPEKRSEDETGENRQTDTSPVEGEGDKVTETDSNQEKQRSPKVRLVLRPLTDDENEGGGGDQGCCERRSSECGKGRQESAESAGRGAKCARAGDGSGALFPSDDSCKEDKFTMPPNKGSGDVSSQASTSQELKETLVDLNEALECATTGEEGTEKCRQTKEHFREKRKIRLRNISEHPLEPEREKKDTEIGWDLEKPPKLVKTQDTDELSMFEHVEITSQFPRRAKEPAAISSDPLKSIEDSELLKALNNPAPREYPQTYHSLEFLPYNPLLEELDSAIFPNKDMPLPLYDDPYWPSKRDCLVLLGEIRAKPNYVTFTGTFITPEARGADVGKLFASVPPDLPGYMQHPPRCTDIVDLPYSMAAMDHLEPIMYRNNFRVRLDYGEKGLKKVLVHTVTGDLDVDFSFEESGQRAYAAMLKNGPNWVLFNIASLYWRVKGDPSNALECLRRAVHFAPDDVRGVGYVGVANVLHRVGYLNEAVIAVRAALDVYRDSPVSHYTLASIYLSLHDYVASTVHLRAALHNQPSFDHALSALKMVRCSMKFSVEKTQLRKKMQEEEARLLKEHEEQLLKDLKEAVRAEKEGRKMPRHTKPAIVLENREPPEIPEFKIEEAVPSPYTGDDAMLYMFRLSLFSRIRKKLLEDAEKESAKAKKSTEKKDGEEIGDSSDKRSVHAELKEGSLALDDSGEGISKSNENGDSIPTKDTEGGKTASKIKKSKSKSKKKSKKASPPKAAATTIDNQQGYERDPEVDRILHEVVETLNRNQTPVQRKLPSRVLPRNREPIREENIRLHKKPNARPWPKLDDCIENPQPKFLVFTSTWLSVTAKGVDVRKFMDFTTPLDHYPILPYCHNNFEPSRKTLDHLTGMNSHPLMQYKAEKGLQEVLCTLDGSRRSLDEMATRIKLSMDKNTTSWVLSNLAALYWRVVGQGQLAIKCLKHALYYSDENSRDVALVSLSNVLYRSGFDKDATAVIHMSLEVCQRTSACEASPTMVVTHFTMANILAAQGFYAEAASFYENTLNFQPEFKPAADRLKTVRCLMLIAKNQHLLQDKEKKKTSESI